MLNSKIQDITQLNRTPYSKDKRYQKFYGRHGTEAIGLLFIPKKHINELDLDPLFVHSKENMQRKYFELDRKFQEQWKIKSSVFLPRYSAFFVKEVFNEVFSKLDAINVSNLTFSITSDISIFFQGCRDRNNIYLEVFFEEEFDEKIDAVMNIYDKKNTAHGFSGTIDEMIREIELFSRDLDDEKIEVTTTELLTSYELSENTFATTSL